MGLAVGRSGSTGSGTDELTSGREPRSRRGLPRPAVGAIAVFGTLSLVLVGLGSGHRAEPAAPPPRPTGPPVVVDTVCTLITDGGRGLVVTFRVANATAGPLRLDSVSPDLPLGGLSPQSVTYSTGDCLRSVPAAAGASLGPAQGIRVTFRLGLPETCPAALPVSATVLAHTAGDREIRQTLRVLPDLGQLPFDTCPG